jgi:hypothetical protein
MCIGTNRSITQPKADNANTHCCETNAESKNKTTMCKRTCSVITNLKRWSKNRKSLIMYPGFEMILSRKKLKATDSVQARHTVRGVLGIFRWSFVLMGKGHFPYHQNKKNSNFIRLWEGMGDPERVVFNAAPAPSNRWMGFGSRARWCWCA